jgi:hypothetical protein
VNKPHLFSLGNKHYLYTCHNEFLLFFIKIYDLNINFLMLSSSQQFTLLFLFKVSSFIMKFFFQEIEYGPVGHRRLYKTKPLAIFYDSRDFLKVSRLYTGQTSYYVIITCETIYSIIH